MVKIFFRWQALLVPVMICFVLTVGINMGRAQENAKISDSDAERSLTGFLKTLDDDRTLKYVVAFRDLNNDGNSEAIVYLIGKKWCGSGGCNLLVFTPRAEAWKIVTNIRLVRPPIYVLAGTSNGWHNLAVWVQGGGIQPGYEAELRYDGKTYPQNPSLYPVQRLEKEPEEAVIGLTRDEKRLY